MSQPRFQPDDTSRGVDYLYHTSTFVCDSKTESIELYCPFIPDTISFHMCAQGHLVVDANPINNEMKLPVPFWFNGFNESFPSLFIQTVVAESTDLIVGSPRVAVCNFANTYNPVTRFSNMARKEYRGNYNIRFFTPPAYNIQNVGLYVLTIEFSRKRTAEDR